MKWLIRKSNTWRKWFAWYPVQVGHYKAWLMIIERKWSPGKGYPQENILFPYYRFVGEEKE